MTTFLRSFFLLDVDLLLLLRRRSKWVLYVLLAVAVTLVIALPSWGLAVSILNGQLEQMQSTEAWWDSLWQRTYASGTVGGNGQVGAADFMFISVTSWIFRLAVLYFVYRFSLKSAQIVNGNITDAAGVMVPIIIPFFLAIMMLSNQAYIARSIPMAMRDIKDVWVQGMMEARITDLTAKEALDDVFATKEASNQIYLQANECAKMPKAAVSLPSPNRPTDPKAVERLTPAQKQGYDYLDCLKSLEKIAEEAQAKCPIINVGNCGPFFRSFLNRTVKTINGVAAKAGRDFMSGKGIDPIDSLLSLVAGVAKNEAARPFFTAVQWCYTNMLELALWIDGLMAPIAVALMLIPGRLNLFVTWFISIFTICLAQVIYVLVVGVNALLISQTNFDPGDLNFEMAIGIFAPLMSLAVVAGGGFAASQSFVGQSVTLASATLSAVSMAVSSGASKFAATKKW